jgi:aspartate/methionine/tyrosine aminotransferase
MTDSITNLLVNKFKTNQLDNERIDLGLAYIDFNAPEPAKKAAIDAIIKNKYSYGDGFLELRQAVVRKMAIHSNVEIHKENIIATVGAANGIWLATKAVLKPRDEALFVTPTYTAIFNDIAFAGAKAIPCKTNRNHHLDLEEIEKKITSNTRMIAICNPNNPTGTVYTKNELEGLADIASRKKLYVFSDELYDRLTYDGRKHVSIIGLSGLEDLAIVVGGTSKIYGMSGFRIGYVIASKELIGKMWGINAPILIHPGAIDQIASAAALNECDKWVEQLKSHCERMRNLLCNSLDKIEKISCSRPEGTFFATPDISQICKNDVEASTLVGKYGVSVSPGSFFGEGFDNYIRIKFATPEENMKNAIERITAAFTEKC